MHPFLTLAHAYAQGQVTRDEYRARVAALRSTPPKLAEYANYGIETGTPTAILLEVVKPLLLSFTREHSDQHTDSNPIRGALQLLAERISRSSVVPGDPSLLVSVDTAYRRLSGILAEQSEITHIRWADFILLALGERCGEPTHALPFLPLTQESAEAQLDGWLETTKQKMDEFEHKQLAHSLHRFAIGFANGGRLTGDDAAVSREERLIREAAVKRKRKAAERMAS